MFSKCDTYVTQIANPDPPGCAGSTPAVGVCFF
jgi:hypothetical protein